MTMTDIVIEVHPTNLQRLRVALALTALKYKQKNQSIASYVLDLRARFPSKIVRHYGILPESWRERALVLEDELASLKRKSECDLMELTELRTKFAGLDDSISSTQKESLVEPLPKKKKRKVNACSNNIVVPDSSTNMRIEFELLIKQPFFDTIALPTVWESFNILSGYQNLSSLDSQECLAVQKSEAIWEKLTSKVISVTTAVVNGIGLTLESVLQPVSQDMLGTSNSVKSLRTIFARSLATAVGILESPKLKPKTMPKIKTPTLHLDSLITGITLRVLRPLMASLSSLAFNLAITISDTSVTQSKKANDNRRFNGPPTELDIRQDVVAFIHHIFMILQESLLFKNYTGGVLEYITLQSAREIEKLWADTTTTNSNHSYTKDTPLISNGSSISNHLFLHPFSQVDRLKILTRKDTLWYHCSILHFVLKSSTHSTPGFTGVSISFSLLAEKIIDILNCLYSRCGRYNERRCILPGCMDEVERGMIMAVLENAWMLGYTGA